LQKLEMANKQTSRPRLPSHIKTKRGEILAGNDF
jgi:hypothetical protein